MPLAGANASSAAVALQTLSGIDLAELRGRLVSTMRCRGVNQCAPPLNHQKPLNRRDRVRGLRSGGECQLSRCAVCAAPGGYLGNSFGSSFGSTPGGVGSWLCAASIGRSPRPKPYAPTNTRQTVVSLIGCQVRSR